MFDDKLKLKFGLFGKKNQMESTTSGVASEVGYMARQLVETRLIR